MTQIQFSYYELSLLSFLQESFPELSTDIAFIKSRAALAAEAYSTALLNGYTPDGASEVAGEVLYENLHFSKHDTLINIIWNEFADEVPQSAARELAIKLQPLVEPVFAKYTLSDDFAYSTEYEQLYTELTGEVVIYLAANGL